MKKLFFAIALLFTVSMSTVSCSPENIVEENEQLTDQEDSTNPNSGDGEDPDNGEG